MQKVKSLSLGLLGIAVVYLLFRVSMVSAERDSALKEAGAWRVSAEASGKVISQQEAMRKSMDALLLQREKDHAEIAGQRQELRATVRKLERTDQTFADWRKAPLPAQYRPGANGLLGKTAAYHRAGPGSGDASGQPSGSAPTP